MPEVIISQDLFHEAAEKIIDIANDSIKMRGRFSIALAGGSTPKELYKLLASKEFRDKADWEKVFFFFGDERDAMPDSDESNFKMANEALFLPLGIPEENIFRWEPEYKMPEMIAQSYNSRLAAFFKGLPRFDLILLGMGNDGHTASLFPYTGALSIDHQSAFENWIEKMNCWRFTLTFSAINNARNVIFLVKGEDKAGMLQRVLEGEYLPDELPAQGVKPKEGRLFWMLDKNAAKLLKKYGN